MDFDVPIIRELPPQKVKVMSDELMNRLGYGLEAFDTGGNKMQAARKAYLAARRDWPTLPLPVFEELVESWTMETAEGNVTWSLSDFIQEALLFYLDPHVAIQFRGKTFSVKAVSGAGTRALTTLYERGVRISGDLREALLTLWMAIPPISAEDGEAAAVARWFPELQEVR